MRELSDIPDIRDLPDVEWEADSDFLSPTDAGRLFAAPPADQTLLHAVVEPPRIRERLHAICALYVHAPSIDQRLELLDRLEDMTLRLGHILAVDLLDAGWRPEPDFDRGKAVLELGLLDPLAPRSRAA